MRIKTSVTIAGLGMFSGFTYDLLSSINMATNMATIGDNRLDILFDTIEFLSIILLFYTLDLFSIRTIVKALGAYGKVLVLSMSLAGATLITLCKIVLYSGGHTLELLLSILIPVYLALIPLLVLISTKLLCLSIERIKRYPLLYNIALKFNIKCIERIYGLGDEYKVFAEKIVSKYIATVLAILTISISVATTLVQLLLDIFFTPLIVVSILVHYLSKGATERIDLDMNILKLVSDSLVKRRDLKPSLSLRYFTLFMLTIFILLSNILYIDVY